MKYTLTLSDMTREEYLAALAGKAPLMVNDSHDPVTTPTVEPEPVATPTTDNLPSQDIRGFAWDERIHAGTKAINQDGTWRYKRGVEQSVITEVEAEIGETSEPVTAPEPTAGVEAQPQPTAPAIPVPTSEPETTTPTPSPVQPVAYDTTVARLGSAINEGKITAADVPGIYAWCGVTGVAELPGNQAAIEKLSAKLDELNA